MRAFAYLLSLTLVAASPAAVLAQSTTIRPSQTVRTPLDFDQNRDAATRGSHRYRPSGNPPQISEAKALAAELGVACKVIDAAPIAKHDIKGPNGKVRIISYEIACRDDFGWIISKQSDGVTEAFNCLALDTSARAAGKSWSPEAMCLLPDNGSNRPGLSALAAKATPTCQLGDGAYLGQGGQPAIIRYELSCKGADGYIVDAPAPGSKAAFSAMSCKDAKAAGAACGAAVGNKRGG
jgi:hypothetical protein